MQKRNLLMILALFGAMAALQAQKTDQNQVVADVKLDGKWGIIDKSGNVVIPCKYDNEYLSFNEDLAAVELDGKWGFIDKSGKLVIPCKYEYAGGFSDGLALVKLDGKWGFIDKSDKLVIPCKYEEASFFHKMDYFE